MYTTTLDQAGQSSQRTDTGVDGHPISLIDRITVRKCSVTPRAEENVEVHRDGFESQAVSASAKTVRRRDGCVGQEVFDGSSSTRSCEVPHVRLKRLDQFGVFTPTRTLATWQLATDFQTGLFPINAFTFCFATTHSSSQKQASP